MQHLINIIGLSAIYLLIAYSFLMMYTLVKFFNLAHAAIIAIGAYSFFFCLKQQEFTFGLSLFLSILSSGIIGVLLYKFIYRPLLIKKNPSLVFLVVSLGIYVVLSNIISIIWKDGTKSIRPSFIGDIISFNGFYIADFHLFTIITCAILIIVFSIFQNHSKLGIQYVASSENETLSKIFGINVERIKYIVFFVASAIGALTGILYGLDTDLTPNMGFQVLLYGIIVMIIGGIGNIWGLVSSSILLASAQHFGAFYFDSKWMEAISYLILIVFLILKPLGFSGKHLRKVEI